MGMRSKFGTAVTQTLTQPLSDYSFLKILMNLKNVWQMPKSLKDLCLATESVTRGTDLILPIIQCNPYI